MPSVISLNRSSLRLWSLRTLRIVRLLHPEASSELKAGRCVDSDPVCLSGNVTLKGRLRLSLRASTSLCPIKLCGECSIKLPDGLWGGTDLNFGCKTERLLGEALSLLRWTACSASCGTIGCFVFAKSLPYFGTL
jgi:hypothetical protein